MRVRQSLGESSASELFQKKFADEFTKFHDEAVMFARGNAEINDTWLDTLLKEGLGVSVTVALGIVAIRVQWLFYRRLFRRVLRFQLPSAGRCWCWFS